MPDFLRQLQHLRLPSWMNQGEAATLLRAARRFWQWCYGWLLYPLNQLDAATCSVPLLNILAYQRDIQRFNGEPLDLFRKRVQHAFINAGDAGSVAGFAAIFARLGVGEIVQLERQLGIDWDVILIRVNDQQLAENNTLMMALIRQYGRTCRRYTFQVVNTKIITLYPGEFANEYDYYHAYLKTTPGVIKAELSYTPTHLQHTHEIYRSH